MKFHMTNSSEGRSTIVIMEENGESEIINDSHPNYLRIAEALLHGEDPTEWLSSNTDWFEDQYNEYEDDTEDCDDEYEYADDDFEPAPVIESLSDTIARYRREGRNAENLVRFMLRLKKNPSKRSQEQLFQWAQAKDLTVDPDGYLIAYKGVTTDMLSLNSGTASVDGVVFTGQIPNLLGTVVTMPRSECQDDFRVGCSTGLHVGAWDYARSWGPVVLEVRVDPADVVSVPSDSQWQKMRCCEYLILAVHETATDDLSDYEPEATWDEEEAFEDAFVSIMPVPFMNRLRDRILRRSN